MTKTMAAMQIPTAFGSSSTPSHAAGSRGKTAAVMPKLRDCCLGCASSKVRCPREKPACSRCVKRKITCEYGASKRAGRKHDSSNGHVSHSGRAGSISDLNLDDTGNLNAAFPGTTALASTGPDAVLRLSPTLSSWFAPNATTTTAPTKSLDTGFLLSSGGLATDASLERTTSANTSQPSLGVLSPDNHESDNFPASLMPFMTATSSDADSLLSDALDFGGGSSSDGISSNLVLTPGALLNDNFSGLSNTAHTACSSESPVNKSTSSVSSGGDQIMTDSRCSCLAQALELMRQLFPHPSAYCTTSGTSGGDDTLLLPTVPVVIERNKQTVKAVSAMLACSCSQDVHLLAIMAHIVFKVLGWYAVAARRTQRTPPSPSVTGTNTINSNNSSNSSNSSGGRCSSTRRSSTATSSSYVEQVCWQADKVGRYRLDGDDSGRMAAQLVLSELHLVQSLVRELAVKLKAQNNTEPQSTSAGRIADQSPSPFSGAVLDLLGIDLRKRLKELSVDIVRSLRNV